MKTINAIIRDTARKGAYLPSSLGFRECADLDGKTARAFLESAGFEVVRNGDNGTNGFAETAGGLVLSTNGYCYYSA